MKNIKSIALVLATGECLDGCMGTAATELKPDIERLLV